MEIEMKAAGLLDFGTELDNPSFADLANAAGIQGIRVEDPGDLQDAVARAFSHDGPSLLDVVVNRQELAMPPSIQLEQAKGFTLYMLKAVMSGEATRSSSSPGPTSGAERAASSGGGRRSASVPSNQASYLERNL